MSFIINPYVFGGGTLLLDLYPSAAVAYSLRKLRTAYTGSAIRIRRSSDNTEQDIGFIGENLDTQTMLDFVGYNLLTYSEDVSQTSWVKSRATATANVTTAPDGLNTAGKYIEDLTLGEHGGSRAAPIVNGTTYNVSCYFKQAERTKIRFYSAISGSKSFDVDLTNGNVTNNGFANIPLVTAVANGFYRISITDTATSSSSVQIMSFRTYNASNTITYTGDGTSGVYVWGAQLTQSSSIKTYEKTGATANGEGFITKWYDQSGNANDAAQTTVANQAQIVSVSALITDPNTSKISATWTGDAYTFSNVAVTQNLLMSAVSNRIATNNNLRPISTSSSGLELYYWSSTGDVTSQLGSGSAVVTHETGNTTTGAYIISALRDSSSVVKAWRNTTALSTGTSTGTSAVFTRFGQRQLGLQTCRMVEMIHWNNDKESSRTGIVTNQNTYWNVY